MTEATTTQGTQEETTYCTVHPTVEAVLRCNKCDRPMCTRCAVRTPVGYRCRQCVTAQQDIYFTAEMRDYVIAGVAAFLVSAVIGGVLVRIGFLILTLLLSAPAGGLISEIVWRLSGRRRGALQLDCRAVVRRARRAARVGIDVGTAWAHAAGDVPGQRGALCGDRSRCGGVALPAWHSALMRETDRNVDRTARAGLRHY